MTALETIAIFSPSLQIGGAERAVVNLANGFSREGKAVSLLLAVAQGPLCNELDPGVEIIDLRQRGVFGALAPLSRFLQIECPDILFSAQSHANLIALLARKLARVNLPVVINEQTTMSVHYALEPGLKNRIVPKLARLFYRQADAVVCISQGVADDILAVTKISSERVHRIYNPVLPPLAELEQKIKASVEHPWFFPESPPVILAVGRLTTAKDYPTLLRAFALARQEREMRLLILGEGEKRNELEALVRSIKIGDDVQLPGSVSNPFGYMVRSSVFALSSAWEGLSNVLVEALACGAPIVATDCKYGPAEILDYGKYGTLVPVGDAEAMAEAILETLNEHPDRTSLRRRSLDFTLETIVQQYLVLFDAVIRGRNIRYS
ncbi:MAG: glycosyltransferase [Chloroflexi bacterium]|nr:glycosyltransferase [Chloroflexota bacterium]